MRRVSHGFTLIELIAVMAILVVLTSLVIPRIDSMTVKANKAASASNMHAGARSIMLFKAMHNSYPNPWDSLLTAADGNLWQSPGADGPGLEPQLTGGFLGSTSGSGFPQKLTKVKLTQKLVDSLARTGLLEVVDLDSSAVGSTIPGNCFKTSTPRTFKDGDFVAAINQTDEDGQNIWRQAFPGQKDDEIFGAGGAASPDAFTGASGSLCQKGILIALGIGPRNELNGEQTLNVPSYPNLDPNKFYNRLIAVFYVRGDTAKRTYLRGVIGADGDLMAEEVEDFNAVEVDK